MAPFNAAQLAIIENEWERKGPDKERPDKECCIAVAVLCNDVGPTVTSQAIGRYFSNRAAAEAGRPLLIRKTEKQLAMLKESFKDDPYPCVGEQILLVHETGLQPKQIKSWFDSHRVQAVKRGEELWTANENNHYSGTRMWRAYNKDPEGYVKLLTSGKISGVDGREQDIEEELEEFNSENEPEEVKPIKAELDET